MEKTLYAWFDTEYSNLNLETAVILQVALVVTDDSLERVLPVENDVRLAVKLPESVGVSLWVKENLPDLVQQCRSPGAVDIADVDERLRDYVAAVERSLGSGADQRPVLAGNSIHADWWLARRFLPKFLEHLHYRQLDVTALKLEWKRLHHQEEFDKDKVENVVKWFPGAHLEGAGSRHDAYYDAQASIAELAFYRRHLFGNSR
jgi:oligoribonuclease